MLNVPNKPFMLAFVMLKVVTLSVVMLTHVVLSFGRTMMKFPALAVSLRGNETAVYFHLSR